MLSGEISLCWWCSSLEKARLVRPHFGSQTWPPRSSINPDQPEWQPKRILMNMVATHTNQTSLPLIFEDLVKVVPESFA
ncbi:hypothetical protein MH1LPH_11550 [Lactiplantibacillus brownii]